MIDISVQKVQELSVNSMMLGTSRGVMFNEQN